MPRSARTCQLIALARSAPKAPRYCLSFTAAGLRPELAAVIAGIHLEEHGDWARTKTAVLERNALQARSARSSKVLETEPQPEPAYPAAWWLIQLEEEPQELEPPLRWSV